MLKIVYDRRGTVDFLPNLVQEQQASDVLYRRTANQPPYSSDFQFRRYLDLENIPYQELQVDHYDDTTGVYPIHLTRFDPDIDYLALIDQDTLQQVRARRLTILFYYEDGSSPVSDIIPSLDRLADVHEIDRSHIKFISANAVCEKYDNFIYLPTSEISCRYMNLGGQHVRTVNHGKRHKKLVFCNHSDRAWSRLFAASLWYHGIHNDSYFIYGNTQKDQGPDFDPVWRWHSFWENPRRLCELFALYTPLRAPEPGPDEDAVTRFYDQAYWNIIPESYLRQEDLCLTDQTFRAVLNLQPFVLLGAHGSLKLLRSLGYKTFGRYIDESYDNVQNDEKRLYKCFQLAFYLYNLSDDDHRSLMRLVEPILIHNQEVLLSSKKHRLLQTLEKIR